MREKGTRYLICLKGDAFIVDVCWILTTFTWIIFLQLQEAEKEKATLFLRALNVICAKKE